jgi:HrpA-like RNA helicase
MDTIDSIYNDNTIPNVLILSAETGSGKSVALPVYIHKRFNSYALISEPKVFAAMDIP